MRVRQIAAIGLLMGGWFAIGWIARGVALPAADQDLALVQQVSQIIARESNLDLPPARQMTYAAIRGMLASLGDKYAGFFEPAVAVRDQVASAGDDAVTGLSGELRNGEFVVTGLTSGGPAAEAGLQEGDVVESVDGWWVRPDSKYQEVVYMIRGPVDTTAHLTVRRGTRSLAFDVPRVPAQDVVARTLDGNIAYLRLDRFTSQTPRQMQQALEGLLAGRPAGLIWDLRQNGGGSMDATQQVLDMFLGEGIAFYARVKGGRLIAYPTRDGGIAEDIPLAVLIGPDTYSAPETVAASISDRRRGVLIGSTTHGKGSIINSVRLLDGSMIRLTVADWLSPVGQQSYEGRGVPADIVVQPENAVSVDAVLQQAVDYFRNIHH